MVENCFFPNTMQEATEILSAYGEDVRICAGGTDLLVLMRKERIHPKHLLALDRLGLDTIERKENGSICIGAGVTLSQLVRDPLLRQPGYGALMHAASHVGSLQTRNAATLVGNICTGIASADTAPALMVLDAKVQIVGANGSRIVPVDAFFTGHRKTAAAADEMVTQICLPEPDPQAVSVFRKVGTRKELFISIANAALYAVVTDGVLREIRMAMGVMAPMPVRLKQTEQALLNQPMEERIIQAALDRVADDVSPRTSRHASKEYRMLLARNLLEDFLHALRKRGES